MQEQLSPAVVASFWEPRFPNQLPKRLVAAQELRTDVIELEGEKLIVTPLGFTDSAGTTCLHVPALQLIAAGDAAYNGVHLHLSESPDRQRRQQWIAALNTMKSLKPRIVIAGHKNMQNDDDGARVLEQTRQYIVDFQELAEKTTTAKELYDQMLGRYPEWLNRGALWSAAAARSFRRKYQHGTGANTKNSSRIRGKFCPRRAASRRFDATAGEVSRSQSCGQHGYSNSPTFERGRLNG